LIGLLLVYPPISLEGGADDHSDVPAASPASA
jgi:hypothetical protein